MEVGQNVGPSAGQQCQDQGQGHGPSPPIRPPGEDHTHFQRPHPYRGPMMRMPQRGGRGFGRGGHQSLQNGPPPRFGNCGPYHHNRPPPFPHFHLRQALGPPIMFRPGFPNSGPPNHHRHPLNMNLENFRPGYPNNIPPNLEGNFNGYNGWLNQNQNPGPPQHQHPHPHFQMPKPTGAPGPMNTNMKCPSSNGKFFDDPPYVPQMCIQHFPVLQLYKTDEEKEVADEYCPLNPKASGEGNVYSKLKRGSTGSSSSLASSSSVPEVEEDDIDAESVTDVFDSKMDSKKLQAIVQNFLKTSSPTSPKKEEVVVVTGEVDQKGNIIENRPPAVVKSAEEIRSEEVTLEEGQLVETDDGFYEDAEGFVHAYTYGMMENSDVAKYGVWFGEGNNWNCGERLLSGLQTGKGAHIQGATKAIAILKENGHSKIKINTDSTFMFGHVREWAKKLIDLPAGSLFEPSDWDEYKYSDEIQQLCDSFSEAIVKWTLVDPKCDGTRRAKLLASPPRKRLFFKPKVLAFPPSTNTPCFKPIKDYESTNPNPTSPK